MISQSQLDQQAKAFRMMGWADAGYTEETFRQHIVAWYAAYEQTGMALNMNTTKAMSAEDMLVTCQKLQAEKQATVKAINRRYAGARGLRRTYGDELAEKIIQSHKR